MFPRWLSWMFLLTMGYVIFSASQGGQPVAQHSASIIPPITAETYPALAKATDLEGWKRKLNPDYAANTNCSLDDFPPQNGLGVKVIIDTVGSGAQVTCGQSIRIALTVWGTNGEEAYTGEFPLALGARELAAGFDFGLLGMAVGEQRSLVIPPFALVRAKTSTAPTAALKALSPTRVANVTAKRLE